MAGINCIEQLVSRQPNTFEITVFGREPHYNYNRILLSTVLQGATRIEDITINGKSWYEEHNIKLYTGETVINIDQQEKIVVTDQNREVSFDKLIIATGSNPFVLPIRGSDKKGVLNFRTIEDCKKMIEISKKKKKAVVIGGGLLGLEAARGLLNLGMEVDVVHIAKHIMERQLDPIASKMLQAELEKQGMNFLLEKATEEIIGGVSVEGIRFKDGSKVEADAIVMAVGVRPNIQLAKESGIETNRGIMVNDFLQTNKPDIYAVGECVEHRGIVYGLVKPLYEQGKVLAAHLCEEATDGYHGSTLSTQLKISGVDVFSVGNFIGDETTKIVTHYDQLAGIYKKIVLKDEKVVGSILFGDTKSGNKLLDMTIKQKVITDEEKAVLLQPSDINGSPVAVMEQTDLICNCNGVTKGTIIEACQLKGLTTIDEVKKCTKASSACGGCKPLVTDLLSYIQSDDFDEVVEKETLCSCTDLTDEEIVSQMQLQNLRSINEVMKELNWLSESGCPTCLPALQYYLQMIDPEESKETVRNEKGYATINDDGTYSLTPQLYGGLTSADELRKIADVVERFQVPRVELTRGQRLMLTGIQERDLHSIYLALELPFTSNNLYKVQSVHTCNLALCSCDKRQALDLAIEIEKSTDYLLTPYWVQIGISACLHNGADSTTKDVGVIKVNRGWEIYVGGSSERNVREGQLLCIAETDREVYEVVIGFIQYYRETAKFKERSWEWVDRVNLLHIREVLFDRDLRWQLLSRIEEDAFQHKKVLTNNF